MKQFYAELPINIFSNLFLPYFFFLIAVQNGKSWSNYGHNNVRISLIETDDIILNFMQSSNNFLNFSHNYMN